ncbi:Peptidase family M23 [Cyclobacterium lianum]|uniref:Peptidase family M23 n=1 Tax=Cyclobacterium lianum TaxID=388280 RepID=A0A1M7MIW1_9BACT|nr:M23 family metallopeptidase [Cyclobacterium lianum]SHM90811.1 Peptidase family M23 [Cyclobacterium lianum]
MKLNKPVSIVLLLLIALTLLSQTAENYYLFPIKPGKQNFLAGNMGEIRPNHFHTGLDIKTEGRQGLPVYAAADGYLSRVKISSFGYGNVIYLKHPNGSSTVYAHLRDFEEPIASYVKSKIYEAQQNELEYFPEPGELTVKKGDVIALSGNTGSSGGPHLHFEIRDSLNRAIDPLHAGFAEIKDTTSPIVRRVAISPLDQHSRVNGMFRRQEFYLVYNNGAFRVPPTINISGKVGIEVLAYDQLDEMYNQNGFPVYEIYEEGQRIFRSEVNEVDFTLGRFILVHTYRNRYTRLYKKPNNKFDFYEPDSAFSGAISADPGVSKEITVKLKDAYHNETDLVLDFYGEEAPVLLRNFNYTSGNQTLDYQENHLIINAPKAKNGSLAKFYVNGYVMEIPFAYEGTNKRTYLWDMQLGLPDSVDLCNETVIPEVNAIIPANQQTTYTDRNVTISFEKETLLDDLHLRLSPVQDLIHQGIAINDPYEYLWNSMELSYHASDFRGDKSRTHMYLLYDNGYKNFQGGSWEGNSITFSTRNFGKFVLATDSVPPTIRPIRINQNQMRFVIRDGLSGISDFNAWVDGEWVQMRYEHKQAVIWSDPPSGKALKGELILKVRDRANNESIYRGKI